MSNADRESLFVALGEEGAKTEKRWNCFQRFLFRSRPPGNRALGTGARPASMLTVSVVDALPRGSRPNRTNAARIP